MTLYVILAVAAVVAFLSAIIVAQWHYQRGLRASIVAMHKRASSAEMALASLQGVDRNLNDLDKVQHAQTLQASSAEHLAKRADFESDWLSETGSGVSVGAHDGGTNATDSAED